MDAELGMVWVEVASATDSSGIGFGMGDAHTSHASHGHGYALAQPVLRLFRKATSATNDALLEFHVRSDGNLVYGISRGLRTPLVCFLVATAQ